MERLTRKQIIEDTVVYFNNHTDRRAAVGSVCHYKTEDGRKCAVGRYLTKEGLKNANKLDNLDASILLWDEGLDHDDWFQEKYRGQTRKFWSQLQQLHDYDQYWKEGGGLSEKGWQHVRFLSMEDMTVENTKEFINELRQK